MSEKKKNLCIECGGELKLYELDFKKEVKIMQCSSCNLFHLFTKEMLGGWKIQKVTKDSSHLLI